MLLIAVEVAGAVCDVDCSNFSGTVGRQHPLNLDESLNIKLQQKHILHILHITQKITIQAARCQTSTSAYRSHIQDYVDISWRSAARGIKHVRGG